MSVIQSSRAVTNPDHTETTAPARQVMLDIEGMNCGACAARVEKIVNGLDGVLAANVNLATERLDLRYDPARTG